MKREREDKIIGTCNRARAKAMVFTTLSVSDPTNSIEHLRMAVSELATGFEDVAKVIRKTR